MENLTEEKVCRLAMSPLYILYFVTSEYLPPEQITGRHIVRAMEEGLVWQGPFSEGIFELLRSNLHEFYAEFSRDFTDSFQDDVRGELLAVHALLDRLAGPREMIADFKAALRNLAIFVAGGGAFRKEVEDSGMQDRAAWVAEVFA